MIYSWLTNLIIGIFGFLLVFLLSIKTNTIGTSFIRSLIAFVFFYLIGFLIRWVIRFVLTDTTNIDSNLTQQDQANENKNIDINKQDISEKQQVEQAPTSTRVTNDINTENLESSFKGDIYERTSEYVRELLNEKE